MGFLPCGHISHSESEEQHWASVEFANQTRHRAELGGSLVAKLKKRGKLDPGPFPPTPRTYETELVWEVVRYFSLAKRRIRHKRYLDLVGIYERALSDFHALPACGRAPASFPLLPSTIEGLPPVESLTRPHTGRPPSRPVQERNARIAQLKREDESHQQICKILDSEHVLPPAHWGARTWFWAYRDDPRRVHRLMSKATTQ